MVTQEKKDTLSKMLDLLEPIWEPAAGLKALLEADALNDTICDELLQTIQNASDLVVDSGMQEKLSRLYEKMYELQQKEIAERKIEKIEAKKSLASLDV